MAVTPLGDGGYEVTTETDHTYRVDLPARSCSCPDHRLRGERCKHLRRVAIEITARRVAPPGHERARCDVCGAVTFVREAADPPHLCADCRVTPGDIAVDRETGDSLVVARVVGERADEYVIEATGRTVAEHDTNGGYPDDDLVVEVTYLGDATRREDPRIYAFPYSRLRRTDAELVD